MCKSFLLHTDFLFNEFSEFPVLFSCKRRILKAYVKRSCSPNYAFFMSKGIKRCLSVIASHSAVAYTSERKVFIGKMDYYIVNAATSERQGSKDFIDKTVILSEYIAG